MKKTLFMCALGLTIATSMVAGTMAIYTHEDEVLNDQNYIARAKQFYIHANKTQEIDHMEFAPGESDDWSFQVTNKDANNVISEVDTDVLVNVSFGDNIPWDDFAVTLKNANGDVIGEARPTSNSVEFKDATVYPADVERTETYTLEFKWLDKDADQNDLANTLNDEQDTKLVQDNDGNIKDVNQLPTQKGIKVTVTGKQHV